MKLHIQELKTRGMETPIYCKPYSTVNMKSDSKLGSLKVYIKTHSGDTGRKTVLFFVPLFKQR